MDNSVTSGTWTHDHTVKSRALCQLSYRDKVVAGGFEPPKHNASDLKSLPFDQTREYYQVPSTNEGLNTTDGIRTR